MQPAGIRVALLVRGMRVKARRELLLNLELGLIDDLGGTHALLEEDVRFARLSLAVRMSSTALVSISVVFSVKKAITLTF